MREKVLCAIIVFAAVFSGCNNNPYGPTGRITGVLTMEGKPLPEGHAVSFMQMDKGFLAFGMTDAEGKFEVKSWNGGQMPVGKYDVMIAPPATTDESKLSAEERFENAAAPKAKILFPARYRETTKSGLRYEIKQGDNHFEIDIKSK